VNRLEADKEEELEEDAEKDQKRRRKVIEWLEANDRGDGYDSDKGEDEPRSPSACGCSSFSGITATYDIVGLSFPAIVALPNWIGVVETFSSRERNALPCPPAFRLRCKDGREREGKQARPP
jgi:hypothetical protein